jgi:hypothetical protein
MDNVRVKSGSVINILPSTGTTTTTTGPWMYKDAPQSSFQVVVTGTGTVSTTVQFYVSNDGQNACATPLGTITLSGTNVASDGFTTSAPWKFVQAVVSAISGTNATVQVYSCV